MSAFWPRKGLCFYFCSANWCSQLPSAKLSAAGWPASMPVTPGHVDPLSGSNKYAKLQDLSSGSFGFVQLARNLQTSEPVAIKFIERGDRVSVSRLAQNCPAQGSKLLMKFPIHLHSYVTMQVNKVRLLCRKYWQNFDHRRALVNNRVLCMRP